MSRDLLGTVLVMLFPLSAFAQQPAAIPWSSEVDQAVALAQKTRRPLMFWVQDPSASTDERVELEQERAFHDPLVVELAARFVPVRLSLDEHRDQLEKLGVWPRTNLQIVFATPEGDLIDRLSALGAGKPDILARKMALVFRYYRGQLFTQDIEPKLEDVDSEERDLRSALRLIGEFLILSADECVIRLLDREALSEAVRRQAWETLALLSTPASVEKLLEHATSDEQAAAALAHCTPLAAEQMLKVLDDRDPELFLIVYHAVTRICKFRDVKADRFWQGRNQAIKLSEIERVRRIVTSKAQRWKERYAEYR